MIHGVSAATKLFSRKLNIKLSEMTVRSIRDGYLEELKQRRWPGDSEPLTSFPEKQRGRSLFLGNNLDEKLQLYVNKVREGCGVVSSKIVMAAARGMLLASDRSKLAEYGGHILLNRHWAYSFLRRMNFVQRRATTAKSKYPVSDFAEIKKSFLTSLIQIVTMEEIPAELILNWDQTGIMIVPSNSSTMDKMGTKRVEIVGLKDKRQITAVFCGTILGDFLPLQLIYKGTTSRCHPRFKFPAGWNVTHSKNHWSTEKTMIEYINNIIVPYVDANRNDDNTAALVIMDNFKSQVTPSVLSLLEDNNILVCLLPANTTDRLQPLDISVNKPAKHFLREKFQDWYASQILQQLNPSLNIEDQQLQPIDLSLPLLRELGAKWIVEMAGYFANNPDIIVKGFIRSGISGALDGVNTDEEEIDSNDNEHSEVSSDEETSDEETPETTLESESVSLEREHSVIVLSD